MSEPVDAPAHADSHAPPSPHARFPWVQAAFSAACVGMAAWLWTRYCWQREVEPEDLLPTGSRGARLQKWEGRYVRLTLTNATSWISKSVHVDGLQEAIGGLAYGPAVQGADLTPPSLCPTEAGAIFPPGAGRNALFTDTFFVGFRGGIRPEWTYRGRVKSGWCQKERVLVVDTAASRWHSAPVAGLVVGAMGVFIFALYLNGWVKERRAAA